MLLLSEIPEEIKILVKSDWEEYNLVDAFFSVLKRVPIRYADAIWVEPYEMIALSERTLSKFIPTGEQSQSLAKDKLWNMWGDPYIGAYLSITNKTERKVMYYTRYSYFKDLPVNSTGFRFKKDTYSLTSRKEFNDFCSKYKLKAIVLRYSVEC